ncbi:MAG: hypothetical protein QGD94_08765 [Planctomycetia bacterium]|nr:hypothetical protein [Planctomycetia bacterium]
MGKHHIFMVVFFLAALFGVLLLENAVEVRRWLKEVAARKQNAEAIDPELPQITELFLNAPNSKNLRDFEKDLKEASWFYQLLLTRMQYLNYAVLKDPGENAVAGREDWLFYWPGVRYLVAPYPKVPEDPKQLGAAGAIIAYRDKLAERGINLLVVPVPSKSSIYPEMLTSGAAGAEREIHANTLMLIAELRHAGVEVLDLADAFWKAKKDEPDDAKTRYYLKHDTHWSGKGVRLAAKVIAARIRDLGWAPPATVEYDLKPSTFKREGDIVRMMKNPFVTAATPPRHADCMQVVRRDTGELYVGAPDSPVLILGDSFLEVYRTFPRTPEEVKAGKEARPLSAGLISHLAAELGAPLTAVVNEGGASTLVRQDLARKPGTLVGKKLVVWEFTERDIRFGTDGWQDVPLGKQN